MPCENVRMVSFLVEKADETWISGNNQRYLYLYLENYDVESCYINPF